MDDERLADAQGAILTGGQATSGTLTGGQASGGTLQGNASSTNSACGATDVPQHGAARGRGPVAPGTGDAAAKAPKNARTAELPVWQEISGLTPEAEEKMSRPERRKAIRKLFRHYEELVREALAAHEAESPEEKSERTFLWDPLMEICVALGIARRKLSALTKELTGMAAHEVIDKVRAEVLKEKMEAKLAAYYRSFIKPGYHVKTSRLDLWQELRETRQDPAFELAALAQEYGFANYSRFRRGCMLANGGATPRQIENQIIRNFADWYDHVHSAAFRKERLTRYQHWAWVAENEGKTWNDRWARATSERPEWIAAMREKLGFNPELESYAAQERVGAHEDPDARKACEQRRAENKAKEEKRLAEEAELKKKQAEEEAARRKADGEQKSGG